MKENFDYHFALNIKLRSFVKLYHWRADTYGFLMASNFSGARCKEDRKWKKLVLIFLAAFAFSSCERGRRVYLALDHRIARVPTGAMLPTIPEGGYVVIDRDYYKTNPIQRFDIAVIKDPSGIKNSNGRDTLFVKRVIGLGGETIELRGNKVYIDGKELQEPFTLIPDGPLSKYGPFVIPEGEYFLLGDNRPDSADSRYWDRHSLDKSFFVAKVTEVLKG